MLPHTHTHTTYSVQLCPNDPLPDPSPFTCTSLISHSWSGSAFTGVCLSDELVLNGGSLSGTCGIFTGTASFNDPNLTSSLSFTPTASLNGETIQCVDGSGMLVSASDFILNTGQLLL